MATNAPQDDWHKTGLRLPRDLHQRLHEAAASSGRSYNAEIVSRLESSFSTQEAQPPRDYFKDYRSGAEARREIDLIHTHILMLESESTRIHRQLMEARADYDAAVQNKNFERAREIQEHMGQLDQIAQAADARASGMRERLREMPGFDLPHARSKILDVSVKKPASRK